MHAQFGACKKLFKTFLDLFGQFFTCSELDMRGTLIWLTGLLLT